MNKQLNKEQMMVALAKVKSFKTKNLLQRVQYALKSYKKDPKSVTLADAKSLYNEVMAVPATSLKKKTEEKPSAKKAEPTKKSEPKKAEAKKTEAKKPEAKATKTETSPEDVKSKVVKEALVQFDSLNLPKVANNFKTEVGKITYAEDLLDWKKLDKAVDDGENILLGMVWTKAQLSYYKYSNASGVKTPKSLPNDMDLASVIYVDTENKYFIAVSCYTGNPYLVNNEFFATYDNKEHQGICAGAQSTLFRAN